MKRVIAKFPAVASLRCLIALRFMPCRVRETQMAQL